MPGTKCEFKVFTAMYNALIVAFRCYHCDHSVTYVWCTIVSLVWIPFALTLCDCKMCCIRMVKTLFQKADAVACVVRMTFPLPLCVQKGIALTVLIRKADAWAHVVRTTFAFTLCVRKKFALTFCVCKICAAFRSKCSDTPHPDNICLDTLYL